MREQKVAARKVLSLQMKTAQALESAECKGPDYAGKVLETKVRLHIDIEICIISSLSENVLKQPGSIGSLRQISSVLLKILGPVHEPPSVHPKRLVS